MKENETQKQTNKISPECDPNTGRGGQRKEGLLTGIIGKIFQLAKTNKNQACYHLTLSSHTQLILTSTICAFKHFVQSFSFSSQISCQAPRGIKFLFTLGIMHKENPYYE